MKTKTLLLIALLVLSLNPIFATEKLNVREIKNTPKTEQYCGVSNGQVINFMAQNGYIIKEITSITGSCNVLVKTIDNKSFIVYISEGIIEGFEQVDI
jgi:hypothetical protein